MTVADQSLSARIRERIKKSPDMTFAEACEELVFTEVAALVSTLPFGEELWLKSTSSRKRLSYYIKDGESGVTAGGILAGICAGASDWPRVFGRQTNAYFTIDGQVITGDKPEEEIELLLNVSFDDITVPLILRAERLKSGGAEPKEYRLDMLLDEERIYEVPFLSPEDRAAKGLYEIFSLMELIGDAEVFYELYMLTENEAMQGRRIAEGFLRLVSDNGLKTDPGAWRLWESYRSYAYMKRKWRAVQKRHGIKSLAWEEVHERLSLFAEPIYRSVMENELFWGDWMPELSRYLD